MNTFRAALSCVNIIKKRIIAFAAEYSLARWGMWRLRPGRQAAAGPIDLCRPYLPLGRQATKVEYAVMKSTGNLDYK